MDFIAIDFEASCLPRHGRSFPIEVGICGPDGTRSWLIKPHPFWRDWDWTDEAAYLHGISRDRLERDGLSPQVVLAELMAATAGYRVVADSGIDAEWWSVLARAARSAATCPVEHVDLFLDELGPSADEIFAAQRYADPALPRTSSRRTRRQLALVCSRRADAS